ncbi:PsiF family protein [Arthrobacter sp. NPDC080086]|uniref:PsiF family protein n=1 Tax=Arthrobacter sp. NPDC080086 TaxID=3155917 RepID=UPI00344EA457
MKQLIAACALALPFLAGQAFAQGSAPAAMPAAPAAKNSQQDKMKQCNMDAAGKKGDERKAFMKGCLSDKPMAAKPMTQQEKMAACSKANKGKKGDEYKNAQKECLMNKG